MKSFKFLGTRLLTIQICKDFWSFEAQESVKKNEKYRKNKCDYKRFITLNLNFPGTTALKIYHLR